MPTEPRKDLETFENPFPDRDYIIEIETPEFTCLCPKTGQPDFAHIYIEYVPDRKCVELKSLKLYFWSYRNEGAFHEAVTNTILNDLVAATAPRYMAVRAKFYVRGGVYTTVEAEYLQPGWTPPAAPPDYLPRESRGLPANAEMAEPAERMPSEAAGPGVRSESRFRMLRRSRRTETGIPTQSPPPTSAPPSPAAAAPAVTEPAAPAAAPARPVRPDPVYIGVDFGTTGCRAVGVDADGVILACAESPIPEPAGEDLEITQNPEQWWAALNITLGNLLLDVDPKRVEAIAVDGTSATVLLTDPQGRPLTPALMYNDGRAFEQAERIRAVADAGSGAQGPGSSLAKLLWFQDQGLPAGSAHLLHQADWIAGRLCGRFGVSDENNVLKLGYDVRKSEWPQWFSRLNVETALLPEVVPTGTELGTASREAIKAFGIDTDVRIVAGTTDGVAAFLAAGATEPGQAVTSLGSTLVLKLLSDKPIFSGEHGVYSHKLGRYWLAGGASNSGGAVLLQYFKPEQLTEMTPMLDPENPTGLNYYPLPAVGERFPVNNPDMVARLEPLPGDSVTFFQGILEGITAIEKEGYSLLAKLGAPKLRDVRATGSGSRNPAWARIRGKTLGIKITKAVSDMPAYGTALIAAGKLDAFD